MVSVWAPHWPSLLVVNYPLAVFFCKGTALWCRKYFQHYLGRTTQPYAYGRHNYRTIDETWISQHGVNELVVRKLGIVEPKFIIGRAFTPEQLANSNAHALDETEQYLPVWWCFQIFNDGRFDTSVANEAKNIARRAAVRVVVDNNFTHDAFSSAKTVAAYAEIGAPRPKAHRAVFLGRPTTAMSTNGS